MYLTELPNLLAVLEEYGKEAERLYTTNLGDHNASWTLGNTVKSFIKIGNTSFEVSLNLQEHWKYLEYGSKGTESSPAGARYSAHFPPMDAIANWIKVKPIIPRPDDNGNIPTIKQLSYLISRKILTKGQEPFPALATTVEELNKMYEQKIADALGEDIGRYITLVFGK